MYSNKVLNESTSSLSKVTIRFNKFKIDMNKLKDLHRKVHPITDTSQVIIEEFDVNKKLKQSALNAREQLYVLFYERQRER